MRALVIAAVLALPVTAAAQEIRITGPLVGSSLPSHPTPRNFAIGAHGTPTGCGAIARHRPWRAFAFDFLGDVRADRTVPLVARLTTLLPVDRHDFFFGLGPTVHLHRGRDAVGAELAAGMEAISGSWLFRAEVAAAIVSGPDRRDEIYTVRLGIMNMFGTRVWD